MLQDSVLIANDTISKNKLFRFEIKDFFMMMLTYIKCVCV